jgi:hypothetical protein
MEGFIVSRILSGIFVFLICASALSFPKQPEEGKKIPSSRMTSGVPAATLMNINNLSMWVQDNGLMSRNPFTGSSGVTYPRATATCIFADGLLWGGRVYDGGPETLRVNGQVYQPGTVPGRIVSAGIPEDPNDPTVRIYRVRRDWATADLRQDAAELFNEAPDAVTQADIDSVRNQHKKDWLEWPWQKGAPFYDRDSDGVYSPDPAGLFDPVKDEPGLAGGDQVIWFVMNDLDAAQSQSLYGSDPIGLEIQVTLWGYARPGGEGNSLFKRYKFIYKGTASSPPLSHIDSMYVSQWSDPDLGDYFNDFEGCDTLLGLGYVYNGTASDHLYNAVGLAPPAVGYEFIQGPIVPSAGDSALVNFRWVHDHKNLSMTAWIFFASGGTIADPPYSYLGAYQWYNLLQGLTPITGAPFYYQGGGETRFWLSGDPVENTGYLDGLLDNAGDRRMAATTGPFSMALGDTQEVVIALVGGSGYDRLASVTALKENVQSIQATYSSLAHGPFRARPPLVRITPAYLSPSSTTLTIGADARGIAASAIIAKLLRYDGASVATDTLLDDGVHGDGAVSDSIFGGSISLSPEQAGMYLDVVVRYTDGSSVAFHHTADDISTAGPLLIQNPSVVSDNLNNDGIANPGEDIRYVLSVRNGSLLPLSALTIIPYPEPAARQLGIAALDSSASFSMLYNGEDSLSYFRFDLPGNYSDSLFRIAVWISDTQRNRWTDTIQFQVKNPPNPFYGSPLVHTSGPSEWSLNVLVVDPAQVKNHTYEVSFRDSIDSAGSTGFSLRDRNNGNTLILNHPLPDQYGHDIPVTDGFKILRGASFGRLGLRSDSTRWISDSQAWIEGYRFTADDESGFQGGVTTGFQLGNSYFGALGSSFKPDHSFPVEVRFDSTKPQKAYRLQRSGGYLIQPSNPFTPVPFSVWDVSNRSAPRQMTLAWRDQDNSGTWNPIVEFDGLEVVFIYQKSYDPTGTTQFSMPPNAIQNECTIGAKADIVYGLSLAVVNGHTLSESIGTLYLRPWYAFSPADSFTFNPTIVSVRDERNAVRYSLEQNYPNPFNPSTVIRYSLPSESRVSLKIYTITGQEVVTLIDGLQASGEKSVRWNSVNANHRPVSTGVYFYRLEVRGKDDEGILFRQIKKMLLIR